MSTYPDAPGHRNMETSMASADAIATRQGRLDMDRWSNQPRTSEVRRKGLLLDSGLRRPNGTGKLATVWFAA